MDWDRDLDKEKFHIFPIEIQSSKGVIFKMFIYFDGENIGISAHKNFKGIVSLLQWLSIGHDPKKGTNV